MTDGTTHHYDLAAPEGISVHIGVSGDSELAAKIAAAAEEAIREHERTAT